MNTSLSIPEKMALRMRIVSNTVSQFPCGRYFFCWCGDEVLLKATTDEAAIAEASLLEADLLAGR